MKRIIGDAFPHKEMIKAKGGKWNAAAKEWSVPDEVHHEVQIVVDPDYQSRRPPNGQLWQPCPCCGREPVYLSCGELCEHCEATPWSRRRRKSNRFYE